MGFPRYADVEDQCPIRWLLDFLNPTALKERGDFGQDLFNIGCVECHRGYVGSSLMGIPFQLPTCRQSINGLFLSRITRPCYVCPMGLFRSRFLLCDRRSECPHSTIRRKNTQAGRNSLWHSACFVGMRQKPVRFSEGESNDDGQLTRP